MKKNYNYPKTEEVQLNGCCIMGGLAPASGENTPFNPPSEVDPWG